MRRTKTLPVLDKLNLVKNRQMNLFKVEVAKGDHCSEGTGSGTVAVKEVTAPKGAPSSGSGFGSTISGNGTGSV